MMIREVPRDRRTKRDVKVNLPAELRVRLHESKLLRGEPISLVVTRALEAYLAASGVKLAEDALPGDEHV